MEAKYIDHMGDDLRVANAARVSFDKESNWEYLDDDGQPIIGIQDWEEYRNKVLSLSDSKLINYLAKHNHWTPFSHVQITMREKVPIFVARQRFKHMVGFTYNEVSRRYVDDPPVFYIPDNWRSRPDGSVKQGSGNDVIDVIEWEVNYPYEPPAQVPSDKFYEDFIKHAEWVYKTLIDNDVAPEQARMVLPQSMYTEYYVTGSLAAWARAYKLRIDSHAQKEIQDLAKMWNEVISGISELEHSWKALTQ